MIRNRFEKKYLQVISDHKQMLYRIAYGYLHNDSKSIDALDEAIYLGYTKLNNLRKPEYMKTWLVRILINECLRIIREEKREYVTETMPENQVKVDFEENNINLKLEVDALEENLRKVIVLRYFAGFSINETAKILEIPEGTVSTRQRTALQILRINLSEGDIVNE